MAQIWDLFLGYENARGSYEIKAVNSRGKVEGKAITIREPADEYVWKIHLNGSGPGLGIIPLLQNDTVSWGAIDIDDNKINHSELEKKIKKLKLPLVVARSKSGGAHCFLFAKEPIEATTVQNALEAWAAALGYGGCEIFPKQVSRYNEEDIGNWLNMPYYDAKNTLRYAFSNGKAIDLKTFISKALRIRVSTQELDSIKIISMDNEKTAEGLFQNGPPCLQILHMKGGFPEGTRNDGMYNVAVYLRKRFPDDWEDKIQSYNIEMSDPPLSLGEINKLAKSVSKKDYQYRCKLAPINCHCHRKPCLQREYGVGESAVGPGRIEIGHLVKHQGDPVLWFVEISGHRLMMTTEQLLNQSAFKRAVAEKINRVPSTISQARWDRYIDEKMRTCDIIDSPEDASPLGQFSMLVEQYANGMAQATSVEELAHRFTPFRNFETNEIWFRSRGFLEYLTTHNFRVKSEHHAWQMLRELGATNKFINIQGKGFNVWVIPAPDIIETNKPLPDFGTEEF